MKESAWRAITLLLLGAALKDDQAAIVNNEFWSALTVHPLVAFLKTNSSVLVLLAMALMYFPILRPTRLSTKISTGAGVLLLLYAGATVRTAFFDAGAALKMAQSTLISVVIIVGLGHQVSRLSRDEYNKQAVKGFHFFSCVLILLNLLNLSLGYGFVPGNPRFFGTSVHPNFIGAQLAICNIVLFNYLISQKNKKTWSIVFNLGCLTGGLICQLATGSRTSFVILLCGTAAILTAGKSKSLKIFVALTGAFVLSLYLLAIPHSGPNDESAFYRGEGASDTRTAAWSSMWTTIADHPIFGTGFFSGQSENSYLRAASAFGLPYGILFAGAIIFIIYRCFQKKNLSWSGGGLPYAALIFGLSVGGFLEGYMADLWSLPKVVLLIVAGAALPAGKVTLSSRFGYGDLREKAFKR